MKKEGRKPTHGDSPRNKRRAKEYYAWDHMKARCLRPNNASYIRYGGRGIIICDRWLVYENFLEDMGRAPSSKHSLDRIDNNGDYEPSNCRWATDQQQQENRSDNVYITHNGESLTLSRWSRRLGISKTTLSDRLKKNWPIYKVLQKVAILLIFIASSCTSRNTDEQKTEYTYDKFLDSVFIYTDTGVIHIHLNQLDSYLKKGKKKHALRF